jgi:hypothetical protein
LSGPAGNEIYEVQYNPDGSVKGYQNLSGGGQTINVGGQGPTPYQEESQKLDAKRRSAVIERGQTAVNQLPAIQTAIGLIEQADTQTGGLQPALTGLQGVAADLGVDLESAAQSVGVNLGNLSKKQEFDRLTKKVIIDGFEQFKGNLNQKEVQLAIDAFANLGKDEDANMRALAYTQAAAELARERRVKAANAYTRDQFNALMNEIDQRGPDRLRERAQQLLEQMRENRRNSDLAIGDQGRDGPSAPNRRTEEMSDEELLDFYTDQ